jgi:hypothetical protein
MTKPDTTEDFTAASPDTDEGSSRWARRRPLALPLRLPRPLPRRRRRALVTEEFDPASTDVVYTSPAPKSGHLEPTHRLEGFELRSVASTALLYYGCAFLVLTLGVVLVWFGASMFGVVGRVEEFMRSIGFRDFRFAGFKVITGGVLLSVAAVAFLTVMTVLGAAFYNLLGRPHRGVKLRLTPIAPEHNVEALPHGNGNGSGNGNGDGAHESTPDESSVDLVAGNGATGH